MIELGLVFFLLALICDGVWPSPRPVPGTWFAKSPKRLSTLSATGGRMMIGLGGVLLFTGTEH